MKNSTLFRDLCQELKEAYKDGRISFEQAFDLSASYGQKIAEVSDSLLEKLGGKTMETNTEYGEVVL